MASATFEDHPTDPDKVILRKKPYLDKGRDYEEGFVDGMQHQMQSSVDKAVNRIAQPQQEPDKYAMDIECTKCGAKQSGILTVYTTPPQRTWIGLTQDELNMIGDSMRTWNSWTITDVYFAIEAKLKEKNT